MKRYKLQFFETVHVLKTQRGLPRINKCSMLNQNGGNGTPPVSTIRDIILFLCKLTKKTLGNVIQK